MLKYVGQITAAFISRGGISVKELPEIIEAISVGLGTAGRPMPEDKTAAGRTGRKGRTA